MDYRDYNDNELLLYISENNEDANDILFKKYDPLIKAVANKMYKYCKGTGLEINDLIQEGMLGLNLAINHYDQQRDFNFCTYAKLCIKRRVISLVVGATRQKHKILNSCVSLEMPEEEKYKLNTILSDTSLNPERLVINQEENEEFFMAAKQCLTDLELQVFELKLSGFSYQEIGEILEKDRKSIDNAIQRIRTKVKKIRKDLDLHL